MDPGDGRALLRSWDMRFVGGKGGLIVLCGERVYVGFYVLGDFAGVWVRVFGKVWGLFDVSMRFPLGSSVVKVV